MSNRLKWILQSFLLLLFIFIALALLEGILRLKNSSMKNYDIEMWKYALYLKKRSDDPLLGHEHIPSKKAMLESVEIRINKWGLRGGKVHLQAEKKRRILFLGSSITLGWGVPEKFTLTQELQRLFNKEKASVEVLNAGIGNYNAPRYVERFLTKLAVLKPTDIVVQYFLRDAETLTSGGGNFFLRHSQLAVTLWIVYHRFLDKYQGISLEKHYQEVYEKTNPGYLAMQQSLEKLSLYASKNNIRLYLVMTPDIHNLKNYPFGYVHHQIKKLALKLGYQYIDLLPQFQGLDPLTLWAMPGDPHPNAKAHQRMALAIFPILSHVI